MKITFFTTLILYLIPVNCQMISESRKETPPEYYLKVKQIDEFIKRFNYEIDFKGAKIDRQFEKKISRTDYISLLFDQSDPRLNLSDYCKLKDEFIEDVISLRNNSGIDLFSTSVVSIVVFDANYNNSHTDLIIRLIPDKQPNEVSRWLIIDAELPGLIQSEVTELKFIAPNAHEAGFISLKKDLNETENPFQFVADSIRLTSLSIVLHEIAEKRIKINHTREVFYHIQPIPGWEITVKEFNREGLNSGWLISDLKRL